MGRRMIVFLALGALTLGGGRAAAVNSPTEDPTAISVGLYLLSLSRFDLATGTFTADFYLSLKYAGEGTPPEFELVNGRGVTVEKMLDDPGERFYRIQASFLSPVNLRRFPFDDQYLTIALEDKKQTVDKLVFVPNLRESAVDESVFCPEWKVGPWTADIRTHEYKIYDETFSRYVFTISLLKVTWSAIIKFILPVVFIILIMLSSFILNLDKITTRLAMVGSSLIATVMFHVSLSNQAPALGYLTFADKFMILTYFIILLCFGFNVFLLELCERKAEKLVEALHRSTQFTMFIVVPILYFVLFIVVL